MNVLYIGGTGEISYACVHASAALGHRVTVYNRGRNDEPLPPGVQRITGDLADDAAYARLGQQSWDVVIQFKAYDLPAIERDLRTFAGKTGQYVFISTASAYQKPPRTCIITEDVPLVNPYWQYSATKAQMEQRLLRAHTDGQLPVTVVRPSHTHRRNFPGIVVGGDHVAWRMLNGRPIIIHGDGTSIWTLTCADDFARPFARLLGNSAALGEAFHITRHLEGYSWNQITQAMADALGARPTFVHVTTDALVRENPEWTGPLWGDKSWSVLFDNSKLKRVVGDFTCEVTLEEGLSRAAAHYRRRAPSTKPDLELQTRLDQIAARWGA